MATDSNRRNSNAQLLEELEALSQSLYQTHTTTNRRTASLVLPRTSLPPIITSSDDNAAPKAKDRSTTTTITTTATTNKPRSRRMSLSPWRSRPKLLDDDDQENKLIRDRGKADSTQPDEVKPSSDAKLGSNEKKGIWNWKPIRALTHIGMQKLSCLFSVEVVTVQGLPASMNGLRLSVCVRKKESKDGAVHTMPSRVSQGAADFEETLFIKSHVYCSPASTGKPLRFEPRPFWIYAFAIDAQELNFGRNSVDLSQLIQESMEKSIQGARVRQWDVSYKLSGKAKGGEVVLKLGFQIMEKDGGIDIYSQTQNEGPKSNKSRNFSSSSFGRKQSKTSFSVPSPRMTSRAEAWTPSQTGASVDLQGIDDLNLDEPDPVPAFSASVKKSEETEPVKKEVMEDLDLPDFEVVDKGVEILNKEEEAEEERVYEEISKGKSVSSEVVKDVVHDPLHLSRLTELDSIAQQIKLLESMMGEERTIKTDDETGSQKLDADEETVTKEFLQMLEDEENNEFKFYQSEIPPLQQQDGTEESNDTESKVYLPDLGKGLGCVVQTRDGGYLVAMNPLNTEVGRKDTPKLAMQLSKALVVPSSKSTSGFEVFQQMAAVGFDELSSQILSLMPMDELMGKSAEQIAFEGIASAIIQGRNKEGASSSAARTIAAVKSMATATSTGRKERISTGIWNVNEEPVTAEEMLAFSLQKIETMTVEALKIQAEVAEEEAPFEVSAQSEKIIKGSSGKDENQHHHPLASAIPLEDWIKSYSLSSSSSGDKDAMTVAVVIQARDPMRRYEAVGSPVVALIHAARAEDNKYDEEKRFKVMSLHVGGLKVRTGTGGKRSSLWDGERQRLTAMQWLLAYGLGGKAATKKWKHLLTKGQDLLWSISSRVMADMWLKPIRNPDVKFSK